MSALIADGMDKPIKEVDSIIISFLDLIKIELARWNKVMLQEFGTFTRQTVESRKGSNPKTQEPIIIPKLNRVKFIPSKILKKQLNEKNI